MKWTPEKIAIASIAVGYVGYQVLKPKPVAQEDGDLTVPSNTLDDDDAPPDGSYYAKAEWVRDLVAPIEAVTGWTDLGTFAAAIAYTESRFNPMAGSCANNKACALYGMRWKSTRGDELGQTVESMRNPKWISVYLTWYLDRLQNYAKPGQQVDYLALRRGMALPKLVADVNETMPVTGYEPGERSGDVRERFSIALKKIGVPESFMYKKVTYQWVDPSALVTAMGLQ